MKGDGIVAVDILIDLEKDSVGCRDYNAYSTFWPKIRLTSFVGSLRPRPSVSYEIHSLVRLPALR